MSSSWEQALDQAWAEAATATTTATSLTSTIPTHSSSAASSSSHPVCRSQLPTATSPLQQHPPSHPTITSDRHRVDQEHRRSGPHPHDTATHPAPPASRRAVAAATAWGRALDDAWQGAAAAAPPMPDGPAAPAAGMAAAAAICAWAPSTSRGATTRAPPSFQALSRRSRPTTTATPTARPAAAATFDSAVAAARGGTTATDAAVATPAAVRPHHAGSASARPTPRTPDAATAAAVRSGHAPATSSAARPPAAAAAADAAPARRAPPARRTDGNTSSSDDDDTDSSGETSDATDSSSDALSAFSVDCDRCAHHIRRTANGMRCTDDRCRATICTRCVPRPQDHPDWWCRVHQAARAAGPGGGSAARGEDPPTGAPSCIRDIPRVVAGTRTRAAATSVRATLDTLGDWRNDEDLRELADDLVDTLAFAPSSTTAKGRSAVRRFEEMVGSLPERLASAPPTHDMIDIVLAAYVNARCGVARRRPREWKQLPSRSVVRGEVGAVVGLLRLAELLPADPRTSIPKTRRTLKKCRCCDRHDASPRAYTFMWELECAWRTGAVNRADPRACIVWCMCVVGVCFVLRPKYIRYATLAELTTRPRMFQLRWQRDDKGRPVGRPAGAPEVKVVPPTGLPARHPRLTTAANAMLSIAMHILLHLTPSRAVHNLVFPRVEAARQTTRTPVRATRHVWRPPGGGTPVMAYWWLDTPMTSEQWTRNMRSFLQSVVGPERAPTRIPSGLRGGGEMELAKHRASVAVRATIGWWRQKRISAEGAMITYEGCSTEEMALETSFLGSTYIFVEAPGVFSTTPPPNVARSARHRRSARSRYATVVRRQGERERHLARARAAAASAGASTAAAGDPSS